MEMCLEDLMGLTVTSMSKRVQALQETAAAVHIITEDDLRRTGATSIQVARLVSYYAFFKGWLLLSQPPGCPSDFTSFPT